MSVVRMRMMSVQRSISTTTCWRARGLPVSAAVLGLAVALLAPASARADNVPTVGRVISLEGVATVIHRHRGSVGPEPIKRGDYLHETDEIETGDDTSLQILMTDNSLLAIGANSHFELQRFHVDAKAHKRSVSLRLWLGRLWAHVTHFADRHTNFEVDTPNAVAGVRGTEFVVQVDKDGQTTVTVVEGAVEMSILKGTVKKLLKALEQGRTSNRRMKLHTITAAQLRKILKSIQPGPQLEPNNPLPGSGGSNGTRNKHTKPPDSLPGSGNHHIVPNVPNIEPGSGNVKIKGRIQIQGK